MNTEHPRFGQRLQVWGALLAVLGVTVHMQEHPSILLAGGLLCLVLVVRLTIELSITGNETGEVLAPKFRHISLLNQFSLLVTAFGFMGLMREQ